MLRTSMSSSSAQNWPNSERTNSIRRLAVYVKPRGRLGRQYMAFIAPFRHWVVYPALLRQIERAWQAR